MNKKEFFFLLFFFFIKIKWKGLFLSYYFYSFLKKIVKGFSPIFYLAFVIGLLKPFGIKQGRCKYSKRLNKKKLTCFFPLVNIEVLSKCLIELCSRNLSTKMNGVSSYTGKTFKDVHENGQVRYRNQMRITAIATRIYTGRYIYRELVTWQ